MAKYFTKYYLAWVIVDLLLSIAITADAQYKVLSNVDKGASPNLSIETGSFLDTRDGQIYKTVKIGDQWWMAQNLNYYTSKGSKYYNDDSIKNAAIYGRLYDWNTAYTSCPVGWHLSTHSDWKKMEIYLGVSPSEYRNDAVHYWVGTAQGGMLKDTVLWQGKNAGATNSTRFSALPAGIWYGDNAPEPWRHTFGDLGTSAHFWASEASATEAYLRILCTDSAQIHIYYTDKTAYRSVRCVKDSINTGIPEKGNYGIKDFNLFQNYPNPFNPSTTIRYSLSKPSQVKLAIYDLLGQKIRTLNDSYQGAGDYSLVWNATNEKNNSVGSGIHFCSLVANEMNFQKKMVLIRYEMN